MEKKYHQIPILDFEGKNIEEKESRHDLDKKLMENRDARNSRSRLSNIISE
ncbi:MAG: hypothetical protein WBI74_05900 [Caldicoprobacterales bacterium]|jgi:hypothetical protein|nr:hypothetical protein [Clostridiales bacterium]